MDITNDNGSITRVSNDVVEEVIDLYASTTMPLPNIAETVGLSTYVVGKIVTDFLVRNSICTDELLTDLVQVNGHY